LRSLSRVVWTEGMHLAQHHFQAQSRFFEDLVGFTVSNLFFKPYGLAACELDAEALANGTVSLTHARGIMPDGLTFHFPFDALPAPLGIAALFSPTQDSHLVLLAIPPYRPRFANTAETPQAATNGMRYRTATQHVLDETTGLDEKTVVFAQKNFRLILDSEADSGLVCLPLARVRRNGSGQFAYDPAYIAPILQIGASPPLMRLLAALVETLESKADTMLAERRSQRPSTSDYGSREVVAYWLSHAVHSSLSPLRHLLETRTAHPEELFSEVSALAGALCTFSLTAHPGNLPHYDHDDMERCFGELDRHIRNHLEVLLPTASVTIPVAAVAESYFAGTIADERVLRPGTHWFIGVRSSATQGEIIERVPRVVKFCSGEGIKRLVQRAYPGLTLEYVQSPPSALSPRIATKYFRVHTDGPCWKAIAQSRDIGVYVPAQVPAVELDVQVILPT
jgi:type VI secretion system protein ImpJ